MVFRKKSWIILVKVVGDCSVIRVCIDFVLLIKDLVEFMVLVEVVDLDVLLGFLVKKEGFLQFSSNLPPSIMHLNQ